MAVQMDVDAATSSQTEQPVFFFVKALDGRSFSAEADPSETVETVVTALVNRGIAPTKDLVLVSGRHVLDLRSTVREAGITRDCTVQLLGRLCSTCCPGIWSCVEVLSKLYQQVKHLPMSSDCSSATAAQLQQLCNGATGHIRMLCKASERSSKEFFEAAVEAAVLMQQILDTPQCTSEVQMCVLEGLGTLFQHMLSVVSTIKEQAEGLQRPPSLMKHVGLQEKMHAALSVTLIAVSCAREHGHTYDTWMEKLQAALASLASAMAPNPRAGMVYDMLLELSLAEAAVAKSDLVLLHTLLSQTEGLDSDAQAPKPSSVLRHIRSAGTLAQTAATVGRGLRSEDLLARARADRAVLPCVELLGKTLLECMDLAHVCAQQCLRLKLGWHQRPPTPTYLSFVPELLADVNGLCTIMQTVNSLEVATDVASSYGLRAMHYTRRMLQHALVASILECQRKDAAKQLLKSGAPLWALQQLSPDFANSLPATLGRTFLQECAFPRREGWHDDDDEDIVVMAARRSPPHMLIEDSFGAVMSLEPAQLRLGPPFSFIGEEGSGPGVLREWLTLLSQSLFDPGLALFTRCTEDTAALHPCNGASIQTGWKEYMRFAGRITGLALRHRFTLGIRLSSAFCRMLRCCRRPSGGKAGLAGVELVSAKQAADQGWGVILDDLKEVDAETHHSCEALLTTSNVETLGLTFTTDSGKLCGNGEAELVKGGASVQVTDANKHSFVQGKVNYQLWDACREQVRCFYFGLSEVAESAYSTEPLLLPLTHTELNDLLGGAVGAPDVDDWRAATDPSSGFARDALVLEWFWDAVAAMDGAKRQRLLRFWTGICALPSGGFARLGHRLAIARAAVSGTVLPLPTAHTCFRQLVLAEGYSSAQELSRALDLAMEHMEAFAMV